MLDKLYKIQSGLTARYQGEEAMRYQVLLAVEGVPDCWIALYNPASTLAGVCSNIRQVFVTFVANQQNQGTFVQGNNDGSGSYNQFWTDRTY